MRRRVTVLGLVALLSLAVVAGSLGALSLLPARTAEERLAADALWKLAEREHVRTRVDRYGRTYDASCEVLPQRRERFTDLTGRPLLLEGPYARERSRGPNLPPWYLRQAYLAGCPRFISRIASRRIRRGQEIYARETTFHGRPAHELIVVGPPADVRLLVDRESLEPIGVTMGPDVSASFLP